MATKKKRNGKIDIHILLIFISEQEFNFKSSTNMNRRRLPVLLIQKITEALILLEMRGTNQYI